ncbi:MAG: nickel pincer cofactor biosynthesis protein LarC [Microcystaceae cyanobacterium]
MGKIGYFKCPTGIAGDMCLGALVDGGVPLDYLLKQLKQLGIEEEYDLRAETVQRQSQSATKVHVDLVSQTTHSHRHLPDIEQLITQGNLPPRVVGWSLGIFRQLAIAEGKVHGVSPNQVHFHEVGATDAIVDIVGTCLGLDYLDLDQLYCSALPTGGGTVKAAHGQLSVPVPAVLKLWETRQVPIYDNGIEMELVTPTGAAIVVTLAQEFGSPPPMKLSHIGLGTGNKNFTIPNILQLWIGETEGQIYEQETVMILETQIDDLSPQVMGYVFERLLAVGALDVFSQPVNMKKSRLGTLLTVICYPEKASECEELIFRETTTLGIRHSPQTRTTLQRYFQEVETQYGQVNVKIAKNKAGEILNVQPEYEDCVKLAREHNQPLKLIQKLAVEAWQYCSDNKNLGGRERGERGERGEKNLRYNNRN